MQDWQFQLFSELSAQRLYQILKLRQDVFVLEQTCLYADLDELDQQSAHISLINEEDDSLLAYCRVLPAGVIYDDVAIGRVVVNQQARNKGIAKKLIEKTITFIETEMQASAITISAQSHLQRFYESLGFLVISEPYDEDGIEHITMRLIFT
ncbi:GNAT family N-acetyltransferase [Psychromonas sp. 14N.309.X.WAT.B.A12]|uniref:GNAT family N-acetyltransferase n=1 Tax=unclassified Psychromonas TaxID=2614957 RepID=UPI0025AF7018|nr:GNAT family N-acetyltransferase [Psychromonas sp. 14N.309.X.WAT.B.A12]MDN2662063.1 GNAT family N-acetyltransferase [Psychromonas sp. 14N.309.X.WAT.B.A12]